MTRRDGKGEEETRRDFVTDDGPSVRVAWEELNVTPSRRFEGPAPSSSEEVDPPVSVGTPSTRPELEDGGEIGRGGMGFIRRVTDRRLLRTMAMKTLRPVAHRPDDESRRFVEEAQITGQLDHPNIVPVHELGLDPDGGIYFTMKLVRGQTLGQLIAQLGPTRLDSEHLERIIRYLIKVCDAVDFAHSRGVIHCDLKPSNIMIGSHGQVYVMDWGLAVLLDQPRREKDTKRLLGTPAYLSPEQARNRDVDERSDVYCLGGILYAVITGGPPHRGNNLYDMVFKAGTGEIDAPDAVLDSGAMVPPELCRIAMKALSTEPDERHQSVAVLRGELEQFLRGGGWLATRRFGAGERIIAEGDDAQEAYVIIDGRCEAFTMIDGKREVLRVMGQGEIVGEAALLTAHKRTASVVALDDVTVKVVTRDSLERELERNSWMRALFHGLAERFVELDQMLRELVAKR